MNSRSTFLYACSFLALIPSAFTAKASSDTVLEEVVVTVTRSGAQQSTAPYAIETVSAQSMSNNFARSLPEALQQVPGVAVQKTANGQGSPFIRGFTGYRTLALIDGVRYNNSVYRDGPNEYFSLIDFAALERLEVLNGPAASAYGSDAIGGALNLYTRNAGASRQPLGERFLSGRQSYRFSGAENSHISRSEVALGRGGEWGLLLGYSHKNFGDVEAADLGTLPRTGYDEAAYDSRLDLALSDRWNLTAVYQGLQQDDVWRTHSTIFSRSFAGTEVGTDLRRLKDQRRYLSYVRLSATDVSPNIDRALITLSQQGWAEDGERVRGSGRSLTESFDSRMRGLEVQFTSTTDVAELVYGVDVYRDRVTSARTDFNADGSVDRVRIQGPVGDDARYDLAGIYLQAELSISDRSALTLGSRYSYTAADIGRFEDPASGQAVSFNNSWGALVSSLRISHQLSSGDNSSRLLWAGLSQSFRAPNVADLSRFGGSRSNETEVAATGLDAENFLTAELGIKAESERYRLSASIYHTDISDFVASTPTGRIVDGLVEVSKQNSAGGFIRGAEINTRWRLVGGLSLDGNITWLQGELDAAPVLGAATFREPFSRITPLTTNLGLRWDSEGGRYWASANITIASKADRLSSGDLGDTQRIPPGGTPGYTLINLQAGVQFNDSINGTLGVGNLLDEAYRSHGSGNNEPGRGMRLGVEASF
ncbi:TonB-dependent receptor [Porticoccus sp. W117]|uniref:TonB-dependent receptor n=1 Tax=Porticoccus sp. W117 TaxID=3054777 RepID=UPI00259AA37A|nr:TonB-dependent receptor [Porticoccus sp. W117]MDM3870489.1 TonB-dependent receptor [Porticoccus sp. W117]